MYGDYYKLYNIIILQFKEKNADFAGIITSKKQIPYKDLEPTIEYSIEVIQDIHNDILQVIENIHQYCLEKEKQISDYNQRPMYGFSITSFINTLEYENSIMREQITLYCNYVHFFHNIQKDNLSRLYSKINTFQNDIDENMQKTTKQLPNYALNAQEEVSASTNASNELAPPVELLDISLYDNIDINELSNKSIRDLSNVFIYSSEDNPFSQFTNENTN
jgi:hypothetical protein